MIFKGLTSSWRKSLLALTIALVVILNTTGFLLYKKNIHLQDAANDSMQTQHLISNMVTLKSNFQRMVLAQSNFIISGEKQAINNYYDEGDNLSDSYKSVKYSISDKLDQTALITQLGLLIEKERTIFERGAPYISKPNTGKNLNHSIQEYSTQIDKLINKLIAEQSEILKLKSNKQEAQQTKYVIAFIGSAIISIFALLLANALIGYVIKRQENTEKDLSKTEERYKAFVHQSGEGIWRYEPSTPIDINQSVDSLIDAFYEYGVLAECNDAMAKMYGFESASQIVGTKLGDLLPRNDPHNIAYLQSFIESGFNLNGAESHELDRDGNKKFFLNNLIGIVENGKIVRVWGTQRDITELKKVESSLKNNEENFQHIVNALPQIIWVTESDGYHGFYSQKWYEYTDSNPKETIVEQWSKAVHPDDIDAISQSWAGAVESGQNWEGEFRLRGKDGIYRWFLSRAVPIHDEAGNITKWFGTSTDIEDRIRSEEKERQKSYEMEQLAEKAESASRAKSDFLANMSHEIRTPMNAVIGLASALAATGNLTAKQKEYLDTMQLSAHSLLTLLNDLLDIAKIESSSMQLEYLPFDLNEMISDIVSVVSAGTKDKKLKLELDCKEIDKKTFLGDPTRIGQIITNLCTNAIKFTDKGSVTIISKCEEIGNNKFNVTVAVKDTGIGIDKKQFENIFEKFVQGGKDTSKRFGGTGLGLAISKTLAELMGGSIQVESKLGKGSTFTLKLPLYVYADKSQFEPVKTTVKDLDLSVTPKVLLVEDNKANVLVATALLDSFNYSYDIAYDGRQAVGKVLEKEFDLILMDVQMHGMDGLDATREIRRLEKQGKIKKHAIIGVTAYALSGDREKCIESGMDDYVSKPFSPIVLNDKIKRLLAPKLSEAV